MSLNKGEKHITSSTLKYSIQSYVNNLIPNLLSEASRYSEAASAQGLVKVAVNEPTFL